MKIVVNGTERETGSGTVKELLDELAVRSERVAVELNLNIIRRDDFPSTSLNEGDKLEIVNFVGGG